MYKLKHPELNIIQSEIYKFFGKKIFNVSVSKPVKIDMLVHAFCPWLVENKDYEADIASNTHSGRKSVPTLNQLVKRFVVSTQYPKEFLKAVVCEMTNEEDLQEWLDASPVRTVVDIPEADIEHHIFCYPHYNEDTKECECRSLDPSHILNNLRSQICRHGFVGVATKAFHDVSHVNNKLISQITLSDQMDKQKVSISKDFFSAEVEKILLDLGHTSEAKHY